MEGTGLAFNTVPPNDFGHYELLDALVQMEPAEALDTELAGQFGALGIVKDERFAPDDRLPKDIPAARFWSLTLYDNQTRSMLQTEQLYPRAGSQSYPSPAAEAESDGSTVIHFCPTKPDDVAAGNWIQTDPEKGWFVILRLYRPLQPFFDKTWRAGEVEAVG